MEAAEWCYLKRFYAVLYPAYNKKFNDITKVELILFTTLLVFPLKNRLSHYTEGDLKGMRVRFRTSGILSDI